MAQPNTRTLAILDVLKRTPNVGVTTDTLAHYTAAPTASIRRLLSSLVRQGTQSIQRRNGYWVYVTTEATSAQV